MLLSKEKYGGRIQTYIVVIFFLILFAHFPLLLIKPFFGISCAKTCCAIDLNIVSAVSIVMILLHKRAAELFRWTFFSFSLLLFLSIAIVQFIFFTGYTFKEFLFLTSWVVIPLSVYLYARQFSKLIFPFATLFWVFNAWYGVAALYAGREMNGIPGNRNWHASFLIVVTSLMFFYIYKLLKKYRFSSLSIYVILSAPFSISVLMLYKCYSRAANLALILIIILFLLLLILQKKPKNYKRIVTMCGIAVLCFITLILLLYGDKVAYQITRDIRLPLWKGAIDLFKDNILIGAGAPSYESVYTYYSPIDRFMRSWYYSTRVDHPHNHLLYIAGSFGVFAFLPYLYLWFAPIIICIKKYHCLTARTRLFLFLFIALTIHGMLDLVLFKWPTVFFAFILQGLLWEKTFLLKSQVAKYPSTVNNNSFRLSPLFARCLTYAVASIILYYAVTMTYTNLKSSLYWRAGYIKNIEGDRISALYFFDKSQKTNGNPKAIYQAGFSSLVFLNDYRLGLKYFRLLEKHPDKFIAHANAHTANCLIQYHRNFEALGYLKKETKAYPLSIIAYSNRLNMERKLNLKTEARKTAAILLWILKFKGFSPEDLDKILSNPDMDNRYNEFKTR